MPSPTKGPRLGGGPAHERLILANLATALFEHDSITTTEAKAKRLRPLAERLVTFAKRGDLHARRRVMTVVRDKGAVHRLFVEIAPDMAQRPGGYTRITKVSARKGDNAPMAVIELVREPMSARQASVKEAEAATKRAAKDRSSASDKKSAKKSDKAASPEVAEVAAPTEAAATDAAAAGSADSITDLTDASPTPATQAAGLVSSVEEPVADDTTGTTPAASVEAEYGAGSAEPTADGSAPAGFEVKGNKDSMLFHVPGSQWYDATEAEVWFATAEAAEEAGFKPAGGAAKQDVDES